MSRLQARVNKGSVSTSSMTPSVPSLIDWVFNLLEIFRDVASGRGVKSFPSRYASSHPWCAWRFRRPTALHGEAVRLSLRLRGRCHPLQIRPDRHLEGKPAEGAVLSRLPSFSTWTGGLLGVARAQTESMSAPCIPEGGKRCVTCPPAPAIPWIRNNYQNWNTCV